MSSRCSLGVGLWSLIERLRIGDFGGGLWLVEKGGDLRLAVVLVNAAEGREY